MYTTNAAGMSCLPQHPKYYRLFKQCFQKDHRYLYLRFRNLNRLIDYSNFNARQVPSICYLFYQKTLKANRKHETRKVRIICQAFHIYVTTVQQLIYYDSISVIKDTLLSLQMLESSQELLEFIATKAVYQEDVYYLYVCIYQELGRIYAEQLIYRKFLYDVCLILEPKLIKKDIDMLVLTQILLLSHSTYNYQICDTQFKGQAEQFLALLQLKQKFSIVGAIPFILELFIFEASASEGWYLRYVAIVRSVCNQIEKIQAYGSQERPYPLYANRTAEGIAAAVKVAVDVKQHAMDIFTRLLPRFSIYGFIEMHKYLCELTILYKEVSYAIIKEFTQASYIIQVEIVQSIPEQLLAAAQKDIYIYLFEHLANSSHCIEFLLIFIQKCVLVDHYHVLKHTIIELVCHTLESYREPARQSRLFKSVVALTKVGAFTSDLEHFFEMLGYTQPKLYYVAKIVAQYQVINILDVLLLFVQMLPLFGYESSEETCSMVEHLIPDGQRVLPPMEQILAEMEEHSRPTEAEEQNYWWLSLPKVFMY